jgi:hypothetical protein
MVVVTSGLEMSPKFIAIELTSEEVDQKLKSCLIFHSSCVKYSDSNGYVDYVKEQYCWFRK